MPAALSQESVVVFYLVVWGASSLAGIVYVVFLVRRAAAGDHVVEADPDPQIPNHCVICGVAHPAGSLTIYADQILPGIASRRSRRRYEFPFCGTCAAPTRRRRRIGQNLIASGVFGSIACLLVALITVPYGGAATHLGLVILFTVATEAELIGAVLWRSASGVSVIREDEGNMLFKFKNQVYRDHFAKMNGAE